MVSCWENWNLERLLRKCFVLHYFSHRRLTQLWFRFNPDIIMALFRAKECSWKFQILCKWHVEYIVNVLMATVLDDIKMKGYLISIPTGFLKQTVIFNSVRGRENVESSLLVTVSKPFMFCSRYIFWGPINTVFETSDIFVNHTILCLQKRILVVTWSNPLKILPSNSPMGHFIKLSFWGFVPCFRCIGHA